MNRSAATIATEPVRNRIETHRISIHLLNAAAPIYTNHRNPNIAYLLVIKHGFLENPPQLLVGGFNASEKYENQLGLLFPIYGKIKNVPNHQPD